MTDLNDIANSVNHIRDASDEEHAAARRYVDQHAPDLADVIFGEGK